MIEEFCTNMLNKSVCTLCSEDCGRFFISGNIETEVNFAREINTINSVKI